jgi:fucose permease
MLVGALLQIAAFAIQASAGPFPLFVGAYLVNGVGMAWQQAHANSYVGSVGVRWRMSVLHATYGVGALFAPLLATYFAPRTDWARHYLVSTGLSVLNAASIAAVFRLRTLNGPV